MSRQNELYSKILNYRLYHSLSFTFTFLFSKNLFPSKLSEAHQIRTDNRHR